MDKTQIETILKNIKNPETGKTLSGEDRFVTMNIDKDEVSLVYNRDNISVTQKKEIETNIVENLKSIVSEDNITVSTVSSQTEASTVPPKKVEPQAELKVGHSSLPTKKKIEDIGKVIAISSCKGGVGKSTVAANLALALANQGKKVGLIDADIYGPSLPTMFGLKDSKPSPGAKNKIGPIEAHGIKCMSFGFFIEEEKPVIWRGPMLGGVLNQFLFDVEWGELDFLLIDLPPGTGDIQLSMIQATDIDGAIVVTTPQDVAVKDALKGAKMFEQVNLPILGVVENMSYFVPKDNKRKKYFIFGQGGGEQLAGLLKTPLLTEIPLEEDMREGADIGRPYMSDKKNKKLAGWAAYEKLAASLTGSSKKKGFFSKIFK